MKVFGPDIHREWIAFQSFAVKLIPCLLLHVNLAYPLSTHNIHLNSRFLLPLLSPVLCHIVTPPPPRPPTDLVWIYILLLLFFTWDAVTSLWRLCVQVRPSRGRRSSGTRSELLARWRGSSQFSGNMLKFNNTGVGYLPYVSFLTTEWTEC